MIYVLWIRWSFHELKIDQIKIAMTFLTMLGVIETLCSFRLVLKGEAGKGIPES